MDLPWVLEIESAAPVERRRGHLRAVHAVTGSFAHVVADRIASTKLLVEIFQHRGRLGCGIRPLRLQDKSANPLVVITMGVDPREFLLVLAKRDASQATGSRLV